MYTRCPKCLTCFRVTDRHLAIANGKVRCGQCQHIFNAPEHAVDDIPVNQATDKTTPAAIKSTATSVKPTVTPAVQAVEKKTVASERSSEEKIRPVEKSTPVFEKKEKPVQIQEPVKPREIKIDKPEMKKPAPVAPVFDADATMIADIASIKKDDISEIDLDTPSATQKDIHKVSKEPKEQPETDFTDSGELNAAIEALTQENSNASTSKAKTAEPVSPVKSSRPETNTDNIFSTDAYDATNATSVADVFSEIGQLSLDIPSPDSLGSYDADDEFEFFSLDDEIPLKNEPVNDAKKESVNSSKEKSVEEQFLDEFDFMNEDTGNEDTGEETIDADALFDQIDISDFEDDDKAENVEAAFDTKSADSHFSHSDNNEVPFQLRNDIERLQTPQRRKWHPVFNLVIVLVLLCVTFTQVAYFRAHELVKILPAAQPWLETFCTHTHCLYSGPRDLKQIQMISRDVRQHPKEKNALLISAAMVNQAEFAQPYPDIHIRLSDISGNIIAERIFNAKTYMGKLSNPFLLMKSKTPVHINFEVVDPGRDAVNFEFTFQ